MDQKEFGSIDRMLTTYNKDIEMVMSNVSSGTMNQRLAIHAYVNILFWTFYEL
jgi:hypothetical protein